MPKVKPAKRTVSSLSVKKEIHRRAKFLADRKGVPMSDITTHLINKEYDRVQRSSKRR